MLTLDQALKDQQDLDELCRDKGVMHSIKEVCPQNDFYGNEHVLKEYANFPEEYVLKCKIPHGPKSRYDLLPSWLPRARVPVILCYPPYRENLYAAKTNKKVVLSAAPALYAIQMAEDSNNERIERKGTIFFPSHSTHHNRAIDDYERIAKKLCEWDSRYQPVTICIYWKDYLLGRHLPFQERGMRIVSAGYLHDNPEFLYRLYHLCSMHKFSSANSFGTSVFFSIMAGCNFIPINDMRPTYLMNDKQYRPANFVLASEYFYALCKAYPNGNIEEFTKAAEYFLGKQYMVSSEKMREILMDAEWQYKYSIKENKGISSFHFPYSLMQKLHQGKVMSRKAIKKMAFKNQRGS